jgi:hypothetical protein
MGEAAYSTQIDHRFHGDCDQSFHGKAISASTSMRSVIIKALSWALARKVKPSSVKIVLVTLADGVNDQAHCTPRVTRVPPP